MKKFCPTLLFLVFFLLFFHPKISYATNSTDCSLVTSPEYTGCSSPYYQQQCSQTGYNTCVTIGADPGVNVGCCSWSAATPTPTPAPQCLQNSDCPGCQFCNVGAGTCYDNSAYCAAVYGTGSTCSGGVCSPPTAPTPTSPPSICPSTGGVVSYCSFGGGWYCCGSGMYCIGDASYFTCSSSPPVATPTPDACAAFGGQAGCNAWCISQGQAGCNIGCVGCYSGPAPTATPPPPPGSTPTTAGGGTCPGVCQSSSLLGTACGGGTWAPMGGTCVSGSCQYCAVAFPTSPVATPTIPPPLPTTVPGSTSCSFSPPGPIAAGSASDLILNNILGIVDTESPSTGFTALGIFVINNWPTQFSTRLRFDTPNTTWTVYLHEGSDTGPVVAQCSISTATPTYTISGTVYVDTNSNGAQDVGESGKSGVTVSRGAGSTTTDASGNYSFTALPAGSYTITMTVPSGYTATTTNPVSKILGPSTTANFGVKLSPPPVCNPASLTANPTTVNPGGTSSLSVTGCTNANTPPPTPFTWNPDTGGTCPGASISAAGGAMSPPLPGEQQDAVTWNAPTCPATNLICNTSVGVAGPGGTTTYSANINVNSTYTVTANVRDDLLNNGCVSGSSAYSGSATLSLTNTGTGTTINQNTVTGSTTFTCQNAGNYNLTTTIPTGYRITNRTVSPGPSGLVLNNGVSFAAGPNQTATFCISQVNPWYQTITGDVRKVSITNKVPALSYASSDAVNPSLFISSNWNSDFGSGQASALGWKVDSEYDYNKNSQNKNGTANYSYYMSRLNQSGITPVALPNCTAASCSLSLPTGVYTVDGPITITTFAQQPGAHVVLLVNGDATIKTSIKVPSGVHNLFVLAAKGNITIDSTVGQAVFNSVTTDIEGVITAEGSVTADGGQCAGGNSDLRLNIAGTVVANAMKPFATAGTGVFTNNRSLCANDLTTPSVTFTPRLDFITELTDFYRTISSRWKEVQP